MIIKGVCKCDIDLIQQFIKQEVNIKWLTLSDYNTVALFCYISSMKIVSNKVPARPLRISIQTQQCFVYKWTVFLKESSESMIQLPIHKTVTYFIPDESAVRTNQLNEWFSDKISEYRLLLAVLV